MGVNGSVGATTEDRGTAVGNEGVMTEASEIKSLLKSITFTVSPNFCKFHWALRVAIAPSYGHQRIWVNPYTSNLSRGKEEHIVLPFSRLNLESFVLYIIFQIIFDYVNSAFGSPRKKRSINF